MSGTDRDDEAAKDSRPPGPDPAAEAKPRRRSWLGITLSTLTIALLVFLLGAVWLLGTQSGLRFSLSLAQELAPGLLQVERADGRILGDLHLAGLQVRAPGMHLRLGSLDLRWSPLGVLTGTLRVSELSVRSLDIATARAEEADDEEAEESGPLELPRIVLPVRIELAQILVEDLSIGTLDEDARFVVDRIALGASLLGSTLTLEELAVAIPEPRLEASARGEAELSDDYPLDFAMTWELSQEPALRLAGKATIGGDLEALRLEHDLSGSARAVLRVLVHEVLEGPRWEGGLRILGVDLPAIEPDLPAVDLSGELTTSGDLGEARVSGRLTGEAPDLPDFGRLQAELDLTWREQVLEIAALELTESESGALLTADGELDFSDPAGRVDLEAVWEKLRWPLTGELLAEARQGSLDITGTLNAFAYRVSAELWGRDFPEAELRLTGDGTPEATRIEALRIDTLDGTIEAEGRVSWAPELGWGLTLVAEQIDPGAQWPELPAQIGLELASEGDLDAFAYSLEAAVQSEQLPAATLSLTGRGDIAGTRVEQLRIETLGGHLQAEADVAWAPAVRWDADLVIADIDPGRHWADWTGDLGGRVRSEGILEEAGPRLSAEVLSLAGELRGYPVDAAARMQMAGTEIGIEELRVASGPSNLRAAGSIGERLAIEFGLSSPDLASLLPDARGSIKASGNASGTLEAPAVRLGLQADGVAVGAQGIRSLRGSAQVDLAQGGLTKIDLTGQGLEAGGMAFASLRVEGDGDMGAHRLSANLTGEPLALSLRVAGGLKADNAYAGQLEALELRTEQLGTWRLQKAAPVALAGARIDAGPVCIREAEGSGGCLDFAQQEAGSWSASLDLDRLAFDLFAAFIPDGLVLEGEAKAKADFSAKGGALTGSAGVQVPKGVLSVASGDDTERLELLSFTATRLALDAGGSGLQAKLAVPLTGLGDLAADVSLPGWSLEEPARETQPLRGGVRARVEDFGVLARFVPDITDLTGNLNADFKLGGTLAKPGITGSARLADGGLAVPLIGLEVEDLRFGADASGLDRIAYSGALTAGEGSVRIEGESLMGAEGMSTVISARGDRLTLANTKEFFVLASPDIEVEIAPTGTKLTGTVSVPEARIRPRTIPAGAVSPSADVVLTSEAVEESRYATSIDLRLSLGENVTVNAFGLEGKLRGELGVLQAPGKDILGDGQLEIIEGTYRLSTGGKLSAAVGKPLTISQGFLNYAKSPIANPFLVLTAQREGGDITAGLRVFGTIKKPKMTFFSATDPGMSQSEVTTYLVTGIPPKRGAQNQQDKGVSLGTYVAPKLFAEYETSLGDEADKIKLRYDLNQWIELQTETGESQGGDIFLKFEN